MKAKIDRDRKMVILFDSKTKKLLDEIPFDNWFAFAYRITEKISKSHRC